MYGCFNVGEARLIAIVLIIIKVLGLFFRSPSGMPTEQQFMATIKRVSRRQWQNYKGTRGGTVCEEVFFFGPALGFKLDVERV